MTKSKRFALAFSLITVAILLCASVLPMCVGTAHAAAPVVPDKNTWQSAYTGSYYDNLNTDLSGTAFRTELANLITTTHTHQTSYSELESVFKKSDADPNKSGNIIWFYTGTSVSFNGFGSSVGSTNREHVWAKNGGATFPEKTATGSDAHHLRPTEMQLNASRGNYGFGEVPQTSGNLVREAGNSSYGSSPDGLCYLSGGFFYPAKGYRGATARILFYVQTRWGNAYSLDFTDGATSSNGKLIGKISTLMKWHLEEPPTDQEIRRNEEVFKIQGNRNPFIDHPEYAEMIYCNNGASYSNTLKNVVEQYGGYGDNTVTPPTSISLSVSTLNLNVGQQSARITVSAQPSGAAAGVTWSTGSASVATVNDGIVTAVGAGTTTITATSRYDSNVKASVTVYVTKTELQSLAISPPSLNMTVGGNRTLTVTATPSGAGGSVTWKSSNQSVAIVTQGGLVSAIGAGTTEITATSNEYPNISAKCIVTVTGGEVHLQELVVSHSSVSLAVGQQQRIIVSPMPTNADGRVRWESNNELVAQVSDDGVITAIGEGRAVIKVISVENPSIFAEVQVTVTDEKVTLESLVLSPSFAMMEVGDTKELRVIPSPANANANVIWESNNELVAQVSDDGIITAIGEGSAVIKAISVENPSIFAEVQVTVVKQKVALQSLTADPAELSLKVGESETVNIIPSPIGADGSVRWTSSNTNVATVDEFGVVTAVGVGSVTLTATSLDNSSIRTTVRVTVVGDSANKLTFIQLVENLPSDGTMSGRFEAIKQAAQLYQQLSDSEKQEVATQYAQLVEAATAYNAQADSLNSEVESATDIAGQAVAVVSAALLALAVIFGKWFN